MKRLLLVEFFFVNSVFALDADYIRVTGQGNSIESAKENAFRKAIEVKVGSVIVSERIAVNEQLINNQIDSYSAGYVTDYKLISINNNNGTVHVVYDVQIQDSRIANQNLNNNSSVKMINGDHASDTYNSFMDQKHKADKLLDTVLAGYPKNAITLIQKSYTIVVDSRRNAVIQVPFHLNWNYNFIQSLDEVFGLLIDDIGYFTPAPANIVIMAKNPKDLLIGKKTHHKFNDTTVLYKLNTAMTGPRELRIMLLLRDNGYNVLYKGCSVPDVISGYKPHLYNIGEPRTISIYGNNYEDGMVAVAMTEEQAKSIIPKLTTIEIQAVASKDCQN